LSTAISNEKSSKIPQEFVRGWPVISAAIMGIGLGMSPLPFYTIGVFIKPISEEFGWEPSKVLLALSVYTVFIVFMAPFIGMVTDRIGARKVALTSIIMFGISMMMQSLHTGSLPCTLHYGLLLPSLAPAHCPSLSPRPSTTGLIYTEGKH
jgi:MFS family permease